MKKKVLAAVLGLLIVGLVAGFVYINDYYHADETALAVMQNAVSDTNVTVSSDDGIITFMLGQKDAVQYGMIFYPGGKVEYSAYAPLLYRCAELGIACVLVEMPGNLAVLDMNAAEGMTEQYPHVEHWYMAGHSLGGAMAASYLSSNSECYEGIILLASYATEPLHGERVLSVYGSEDTVLNMEKYEENRGNLPEDYTEVIIEGGCHAFFGDYGLQEGDGTPTITAEAQREQTAQAIVEFMMK